MDLDFLHIGCEVVSSHSSLNVSAALHNSLWNFEKNFRKICCESGGSTCLCCIDSDCVYRKIFVRQLSPDPEIVRLHQKPSLPFSLYVDQIDGNISSCVAGLVVIGSAMQHADIFLRVLLDTISASIGELQQDKPPLLNLFCIDCQGNRHPFSDVSELPETAVFQSARNILESPFTSGQILITIKSPLRLLSGGAIARSFDIAAFVRSQMRRCSSLYAYYGSGLMPIDFKSMTLSVQDADIIDCDIRYKQPFWSNRPVRAGLSGTAECFGLSGPAVNLLILGSYFNAGKGAAFGSGFYRIKVV